ncbi:hypothetical protein DL93DRAFT_2083123 [Clavulina sp. PMI_390]|nr:hypothetical protein DL93DRAFT_2083123 [Clavulina sp. PMI_390]
MLALDLSLSQHLFANIHPVEPTPRVASQKHQTEVESTIQSLAPRQATGFLRPEWGSDDETTLSSSKKTKGKHKVPDPAPDDREWEDESLDETATTSYKRPRGRRRNSEFVTRPSSADGSRLATTSRPGSRAQARGRATQPFGVRVLLQEWKVGEDPEAYHFEPTFAPRPTDDARQNPGGKSSHSSQPFGHAPRLPRSEGASQPVETSQHVPANASHTVQPPSLFSQTKFGFQVPRVNPSAMFSEAPFKAPPSQAGTNSLGHLFQENASDFGSQSQQPVMASTQVLPGPFGGRPVHGAKKAPAKKKKAGF